MNPALEIYTQFADEFTDAHKKEMVQFMNHYASNVDRYEEVAKEANLPYELVAVIHWRESDGNFNTYLHQGDPLGHPCIHEPRYPQVPIFNEWEPAAIHALGMKKDIQQLFGIGFTTYDLNKLCSFAEEYNGLGYRKYHHCASPYVLGGTTGYKKGFYVEDGKFDPEAVDTELGVLPMLRAIIV
jgi:lysozyme family protein